MVLFSERMNFPNVLEKMNVFYRTNDFVGTDLDNRFFRTDF